MKKTLLTLSTSLFIGVLVAQEHTGHCQHNCGPEKKANGPLAHSKFFKNSKAFQSNSLYHYVGSTHQHSGFSDGFPGTSPVDYFDRGRNNGFDFVFGADHSDFYEIPLTLHEDCASADILSCIAIDFTDPIGSILKWPKFEDIAADKTKDGEFVAVRGFEWTSDRFGHINVYFGQNITNAKTDGGYVLLNTFWNWLSTEPNFIPGLSSFLGGYGGGDAIGIFNHPGDKSLFDTDPGFNWNNFEYVADVDSQMVGIEVFNRGRDFAAEGRAFYQEALDAGWHVGAIGSEDHHGNDWSNMSTAKTVIMADTLTTDGLLQAMKARRTYAVRDFGLRMDFFAGDEIMGSRIERKTGSVVNLNGKIESGLNNIIQLVSNQNEIIATFSRNQFNMDVEVSETEKWYYIRVADPTGEETIAYSSPIWIRGGGDIEDKPTTTSVNNIEASAGISIYPNPSKLGTSVSIQSLKNKTIQSLQIIGTDGKLMQVNANLSANNTTANVSTQALAPGIYIVQIKMQSIEAPISKKLIVQ